MVAGKGTQCVNQSLLFASRRCLRFNQPYCRSCPSEWWMIRSVWLAFAFLVFIGALAVFKAGVATPPRLEAAIAADVIEAELAQDVLPKADRLDDVSEPKPVQSVAIVPPAATPQPQEKTTKIISRHWRDSYAKVKKRKHHRYYATHGRASHKKYRRGRH